MYRVVIAGLLAAPFVACVTSGAYRAQVESAEAAQKQAGEAQTQLDQVKKTGDQQKADLVAARDQLQADKHTQDDLQTRLKADDDEVAVLQKQTKELTEALEASRSHRERESKHGKRTAQK